MIVAMLWSAALPGCIEGRWSPVAHDAHLFGWSVTAAYGAAALAAAWRAGVRAGSEAGARAVWIGVALLMAVLALNKQLDLHVLMTAAGRCLAQEQGWIAQRRAVQEALVVAVALGALAAGWGVLRALRGRWRAHAGLLAGLGLVAAFMLLRAAELNHLVAAPGTGAIAAPALRGLELAGPCVILIAALRRPAPPRRRGGAHSEIPDARLHRPSQTVADRDGSGG